MSLISLSTTDSDEDNSGEDSSDEEGDSSNGNRVLLPSFSAQGTWIGRHNLSGTLCWV